MLPAFEFTPDPISQELEPETYARPGRRIERMPVIDQIPAAYERMDLERPTGDMSLTPPPTTYAARPHEPLINTDADVLRLKLRTIARRHIQGGTSAVPELPTLPGVNVLALATRYIEGGRPRFIEYVQLAVLNKYAPAMNWWLVYRDLTPGERMKVSYDDVCAAAQVRPSEFLAAVVECAVEFGQETGNLVAATVHPAVVHQAGKSAKRIGGKHARVGLEDRRMLFEHAKFVPSAHGGTSVHVSANASANAQAAAAAAADPSVPSFAADMAALAPARTTVQHAIDGEVLAPADRVDHETKVAERLQAFADPE